MSIEKRSLLCFLSFLCLLSFHAHAEEAPILYVLDLSRLNATDLGDPAQAKAAWDTMHLAASAQGIVNRDAPRLFLRFMPDPDDFWFDYLRSDGQWLAGREIVHLESVDDLVTTFADVFKGVVVYDDRVYATSNLASTIAGVEDRLCLRYDPAPDSLYTRIMASSLPFAKNAFRLMNDDGSPMFTGAGTIPDANIPSTGSAKCDAYLWAKHRYLDAKRCSDAFMAYYIDAFWLTNPTESSFPNATLSNHDFFIAHRAFFFDLGAWEEETPVDDPGQKPGTDPATLRQLLRTMYDNAQGRVFQIGGFTPWAWKYTDFHKAGSRHGGVDTEWKYARIISSYNGVMDADALGLSGMANASFYRHYPLKERYTQNPKPDEAQLRERGLIAPDGSVAPCVYFCFYMGDYDSAAWFNASVPRWWRDPAHGETLCTWAFNPNLDQRAPHAMDYVRTHQSANDWFMFGDSGAGYLNPGMLGAPRDSGLPDGFVAWIRHNRPYARRYDLSVVGFIIDGHSPGMGAKGMDAYLEFAPDGIVGQKIPPQGLYRDTMPCVRMRLDLGGSPEDASDTLAKMAGANTPKFMFIRTILQSPSWHEDVMDRACAKDPAVRFVDPYTFFALLKVYERNRKNPGKVAATPTSVHYAPPAAKEGIAPVGVGDGPFAIEDIHGTPVLVQDAAGQTRYLYFETVDAFASAFREEGATARVTVRLLDGAPGVLGIHYDSHRGGDYASGPEQTLTGTGNWIDVVFDLFDAHFAHGQNSGADFRLVNNGGTLSVARVTLERVSIATLSR